MPWCPQYHFEFTATFLLFYLFDWKLADLILFFALLKGKIDATERFVYPVCSASGAHIAQTYNGVVRRLQEHQILKYMLNLYCIAIIWNYNPGHNILELYNVLIQVWFAKRLEIFDLKKLGNIKKVSNLSCNIVPSA